MSESSFEKSKRINGYAQSDSVIQRYRRENNGCEQKLEDLYIDRSRVEPIFINSIAEYIKKLEEILPKENMYSNPVFYRVHDNLNYYNCPSSLRTEKKISDEDRMYNEFIRRYPDEFAGCKNTFEELLTMQHYGSFSRCLDLTESPLATLGFACVKDGKFQSRDDTSDYTFATVQLFRAPEENTDFYLKYANSQTVSVLSCMARLEKEFMYGHALMAHKQDGFFNTIDKFIYFRDLIRRSVIVRPSALNPRIKNQKGAFILCNACELTDFYKEAGIKALDFTKAVIEEKIEDNLPANVARIRNGDSKTLNIDVSRLKKLDVWDYGFRKIEPYSPDNKIKEFREDPFNLDPLYFRKNGKRVVFFIPPKAKKEIRKQLEVLGFGYDNIYPEIDTVFHEIVRLRSEENSETAK